jgi:hypothetical protein
VGTLLFGTFLQSNTQGTSTNQAIWKIPMYKIGCLCHILVCYFGKIALFATWFSMQFVISYMYHGLACNIVLYSFYGHTYRQAALIGILVKVCFVNTNS